MPRCMEVGLGPDDFVFDGDPATSGKGAHPPHPIFGPCLLWPRSPISATAKLLLHRWFEGRRPPGAESNEPGELVQWLLSW